MLFLYVYLKRIVSFANLVILLMSEGKGGCKTSPPRLRSISWEDATQLSEGANEETECTN